MSSTIPASSGLGEAAAAIAAVTTSTNGAENVHNRDDLVTSDDPEHVRETMRRALGASL